MCHMLKFKELSGRKNKIKVRVDSSEEEEDEVKKLKVEADEIVSKTGLNPGVRLCYGKCVWSGRVAPAQRDRTLFGGLAAFRVSVKDVSGQGQTTEDLDQDVGSTRQEDMHGGIVSNIPQRRRRRQNHSVYRRLLALVKSTWTGVKTALGMVLFYS
ncbi:hypothetical protein RUM44_001368 [Polyplax serrata]|uniref:Ubiquitin-like domain-containing protein n=1 Tax=Polyplax serrata TaxID=468196 RepID=A0ABR1AJW0_POLSC